MRVNNSHTVNDRTRRLPLIQRSQGFRLVTAALAAGLLAAPYFMPAPANSTAPGVAGSVADRATQILSTTVKDPVSIVVERDAYTATRFVPDDYYPYSRTANTFVNDPHSPIQWPFTQGVPIITGFGPRSAPCDICSTFHKGLDMIPGAGTPIQAIADGVVTAVNSLSWELGVHVKIDHIVGGQRVSSLYAHMQVGTETVSVGDNVTVGQLLGRVGNTGLSMGPHLHFEILLDGNRPVDPFAWLLTHVGS